MKLEIESGNTSNLTVNSKPIVTATRSISIVGSESNLPVTITADFTDIPKSHHEIYFNAFQAAYSDTRIYCNINDEPKPAKEKTKRDWRSGKVETLLNRIWKK